jgi:hypothetical protein
MLKSLFRPKVLGTRDCQKCNLQQDGTSPHKAALVQTWLTERFEEKNHCQERMADSVTGPQSMRFFFVGLFQAEIEQSVAKNIG